MASTENVYYSLRRPVQRRIDAAFTKTFKSLTPSTSADSGAGFIVEDATPNVDAQSQIPLDLVPETLEYLNLPPNDPEVLYVFKNAAEGWKGPNDISANTPKLGVSLEDWRSVCAILLENDEDEEMMDEDDEGDDSDVYKEPSSPSEDGGDNDDDDEDFELGPRVRRTRRTTRRSSRSSSPSFSSTPNKLTKAQEQSALDTYGLFFPTVPLSSLKDQKLLIADIQRVATLLKEKLKAEEIINMLEMFSSSPDKSMSFDDFTRMLVTAKLI
ncbi:hypothetical protein CC1G_11604 [Coprinopsis cinerea okayama7|uniref:EF-hand domain-containing protein n=1 Tax=Coprinopsis cinerea (strain Okayama-7 / 130 / ATCC MYA-4618 / FGSC 9003) TaxID=240176 RepID=A8PCQ1_COPC7|nr:hypothetical protein CC1G_11604 [Coprinopsis cinerea okayama7\|eukprot:XP_001840447.1 hypothetical protein CC1G_11604 [Coprinopsis cinerea okayama7\